MNVKPGDIAICINVMDSRLEENIGRIVTVVSAASYHEHSRACWHIEAQAPGVLGWNGQSFVRTTQCVIGDCNLRPITGLDLDVTEDVGEELTA